MVKVIAFEPAGAMSPRLAVILQRDDDAFVLAFAMMSSVLVLFAMYDNNCSAMNERTVD